MNKRRDYASFVSKVRTRDDYWRQQALLQFGIAVRHMMKAEGLNGKKLARILKVSDPTFSKYFRSDNIGLETMTKIVRGMDAVLHIHVAKRGVPVRFLEGDAAPGVLEPDIQTGSTAGASTNAPPERVYNLQAATF